MASDALLPLAVELLETVGADDAPRRLGLDTAQARPPSCSSLRKRFSLFVLHFTLRVLMQSQDRSNQSNPLHPTRPASQRSCCHRPASSCKSYVRSS